MEHGEIRVKLLVQDGRFAFKEVDMHQGVQRGDTAGISIVHIEGDLYFGSSADLEEKLAPIIGDAQTRVCILRLKRINAVDISAFEIIEGFIRRAKAAGKQVLLCGVGVSMKRFIDKTGISALVGEENIFLAEEKIYASSSKAYERARVLLRAG